MFDLFKRWRERAKNDDRRRKADDGPEKEKKADRSNRGRSPASREQKRQKRARMITRRNP